MGTVYVMPTLQWPSNKNYNFIFIIKSKSKFFYFRPRTQQILHITGRALNIVFFSKNSLKFATTPSPALRCFWLYKKLIANRLFTRIALRALTVSYSDVAREGLQWIVEKHNFSWTPCINFVHPPDLPPDGEVGGVSEGLVDRQAGHQVALLAHVPTVLLHKIKSSSSINE